MECKVRSFLRYTSTNLIGIYPEWNVKDHITPGTEIKSVNWNISRMECKAYMLFYCISFLTHWNISRMECKVN